jgi:hypothetical protein
MEEFAFGAAEVQICSSRQFDALPSEPWEIFASRLQRFILDREPNTPFMPYTFCHTFKLLGTVRVRMVVHQECPKQSIPTPQVLIMIDGHGLSFSKGIVLDGNVQQFKPNFPDIDSAIKSMEKWIGSFGRCQFCDRAGPYIVNDVCRGSDCIRRQGLPDRALNQRKCMECRKAILGTPRIATCGCAWHESCAVRAVEAMGFGRETKVLEDYTCQKCKRCLFGKNAKVVSLYAAMEEVLGGTIGTVHNDRGT